ncbi:hypothetical protein AVEN_188538-1, partial [Araneus ventricosus]
AEFDEANANNDVEAMAEIQSRFASLKPRRYLLENDTDSDEDPESSDENPESSDEDRDSLDEDRDSLDEDRDSLDEDRDSSDDDRDSSDEEDGGVVSPRRKAKRIRH